MNDYTCKIPRSNCVFVGSELAGASSDRLIDVISPLAAGYPSRSSMRNDYRVLDLGGRSSNAERPNGSYRIRREFKSGEFLVRTTENFRASQSFPWYREPQYPNSGQFETSGKPRTENSRKCLPAGLSRGAPH